MHKNMVVSKLQDVPENHKEINLIAELHQAALDKLRKSDFPPEEKARLMTSYSVSLSITTIQLAHYKGKQTKLQAFSSYIQYIEDGLRAHGFFED